MSMSSIKIDMVSGYTHTADKTRTHTHTHTPVCQTCASSCWCIMWQDGGVKFEGPYPTIIYHNVALPGVLVCQLFCLFEQTTTLYCIYSVSLLVDLLIISFHGINCTQLILFVHLTLLGCFRLCKTSLSLSDGFYNSVVSVTTS
jgi:hypothetical protein